MANSLFYNRDHNVVAADGDGLAQSVHDAQGISEIDASDLNLVHALEGARGARVDWEGTEEALTAGTVQSATTLSALVLRNGAGATVLNIRDEDGAGALVYGPITIAANAERVIVFPEQIPASVFATGVFIDVDSGGLNATPGFLIP